MKMTVTLVLIILYFTILSCDFTKEQDSKSKYENIVTKYTEIKQIESSEIDDTFHVFIRLPKYYRSSEKRYPVLYLLDGDISFNMTTSVVRYLQFGKDIPDLIIVAPAYGTLLNDNEINYRERDYTISDVERFSESNGGDKYLAFLKKELIPLIDSTYRTNNKRIINGYSLGGLFTINILLTENDLFDSYIAGSPFLINDITELMVLAKNHSFSDKNKQLFISVGELEDNNRYKIHINKLLQELSKKEGLNVKFTEFKDGTHFTCPPEALAYGLKNIFSFDQVKEQ